MQTFTLELTELECVLLEELLCAMTAKSKTKEQREVLKSNVSIYEKELRESIINKLATA